jgi:hypothetical protein
LAQIGAQVRGVFGQVTACRLRSRAPGCATADLTT